MILEALGLVRDMAVIFEKESASANVDECKGSPILLRFFLFVIYEEAKKNARLEHVRDLLELNGKLDANMIILNELVSSQHEVETVIYYGLVAPFSTTKKKNLRGQGRVG